ncbi:MAG TPA: ComF family protein [Candidatus Polarisedimenticolia bacterium]|nr:ComF family protein [Candidatus Polarisedimenticolia bacterium]
MTFPTFRRLLAPLAAALLPADCLVCRGPLPAIQEGGVCPPCWRSFRRLEGPCCRRCGEPVFAFEHPSPTPAYLCGECRHRDRPFDRCRSSGIYEGSLRDAIHRVKFDGERALGRRLGRWMFRSLAGETAEVDWIAPVPLHPRRVRERGFNQSELLSLAVAEASGVPHAPRLLLKTTPTRSQTTLGKRDRRRNLRGTFALGPGAAVLGKRILLVDDIFTTGCTIEECARVLRRGGARGVRVVTLARTVL